MILTCLIAIVVNLVKKIIQENDVNKKQSLTGFLLGVITFLFYGNVTGIAFQNAREIHSYTPSFVFIFIIFYYNHLTKTEKLIDNKNKIY